MITVAQLQATMAITAVVWFTLYEPSVNLQLSVTIALFTLSTHTFVVRHLPDITTYRVLPTLTLVVLSPILWDCSLFQGRHIIAIIPLFLCAVLFFTVELARGARALADYLRQGYIGFGDDPTTRILTEDQVSTTDVQSRTPSNSIDDPPVIRTTFWRPLRSPGSIALETGNSEQAAPRRLECSRVGSWDSLSTSSMSIRESVADLLSGIDGLLTDGSRTCTLPRERGPYYPSYYVCRWCNSMPPADLGEYQSELDDRQLDPDDRIQPEGW